MTSCNCRTPPGGGGQCGTNQIAICKTVGGSCEVSCVDPSATLIRLVQQRGWTDPLVLENLTATIGDPSDVTRLSDPTFFSNLRRGIYVDRLNMEIFRFQLPLLGSPTGLP
jgi:hypothetical protein